LRTNDVLFCFVRNILGSGDGAPVQGREDLRAQRALTKVIIFTSLQRH